jgi:VWFA-related protein
MNLRSGFVLVCLFCATAAWPAERISIDQLAKIVTSGSAQGLSDAQIAHSLVNVELTERLPASKLESLLSIEIGPRTRDVLQIVADVSAFLEQPPADAPPAEQRQEMLAHARDYTVGYIQALPDFVTTRMTRRFDDFPSPGVRPVAWHDLAFRDNAAGQLSYNQGVESFAGATGIDSGRTSMSSFGEFGSIVAALFLPESQTHFTWAFWETVNEKRLAVFHYSIAADHSRYVVSYCCDRPAQPVSMAAAYQGDLYVDPASGSIWRVTRQTVDLPKGLPTHWAKTIVDYRPARIGRESYLLPVRSASYSESTLHTARGNRTTHYWNDVRFVHYHRFTAEARLVTGEEPQTENPADTSADERPEPWLELDPSVDRLVPEPPDEAVAPGLTAPPAGVTKIRTVVQLVEVPVIVKDRHGEPVTGIEKDDFEVYDNGKRVDVRVFMEERADEPRQSGGRMNRSAPAHADKPPAPSQGLIFSNFPQQHASANHSTYVLIDLQGMDWADRAYAHLEILKFMRQVPWSERSKVYILDGGEFVPLTASAGIVGRLAAGRDSGPFNPLMFRPSGEAAKWHCPRSLTTAEVYLKALAGIAERLASVPGRKTLIWVTAAFPLESCTNLMPPLLKILNNAEVSVYPVDAPGLKTAFADATTEVPKINLARTYNPQFVKWASQTHALPIYQKQTTMLEVAEGTGGRAFLNANDIAGAMQTAADDPRGSYRLGFYQEARNDGQYHRIRVKIADRPELRVRYREGYFDKAAPSDKKTILQNALDSPVDAIGIPLTAELHRNSRKCELKVSIGLAAIALKQEGERWSGKLDVAVMERNDHPAGAGREESRRLDQTLGLQLKQETRDAMLRDGFPYRYSYVPRPEVTALRVVVYDPESGSVGSLIVPVSGCAN